MTDPAIMHIAIDSLLPSPLNPRKTFEPAGVDELASSIRAQGLIQPLVVRAADDGKHEVYVGGRRLAALRLLVERGQWPEHHLPDGMIPVLRRDVDDLEVLRVAVAENINRLDMHPLEEGEAFAELVRRGQTVAAIAAAYGKTERWVQQRIQVARDLDPKTRALFAEGVITMEMARELVRVPEDARMRHVACIERRDSGYRDAVSLRQQVSSDLPPLDIALFDLSQYTGAIERRPFGSYGEKDYFEDFDQFRRLQWIAIDKKSDELRKKWASVDIVRAKNPYFSLTDSEYHQVFGNDNPKLGALIIVHPTLKVSIYTNVRKGKPPAAPTKAEKKASDPLEAISPSRRVFAKNRKTEVLQDAILRAGPRAAMELAIMALLGDGHTCALALDDKGPENRIIGPAVAQALEGWATSLGPDQFEDLAPAHRTPGLRLKSGLDGSAKRRADLYEALTGMSETALAKLFTALVAARCGSFVEQYDIAVGDDPRTLAAAQRVGASMNTSWRIDEPYLQKLDKSQLLDVAAKVGAIDAGGFGAAARVPEAARVPSSLTKRKDAEKMKLGELRAEIATHVRCYRIAYVPPEMAFTDRKSAEAAIRTGKPLPPSPGERRSPGEQMDIEEAIAAANRECSRAACRISPTGCLTAEDLAPLATLLPEHPSFGCLGVRLESPTDPFESIFLLKEQPDSDGTVRYSLDSYHDGFKHFPIAEADPSLLKPFVATLSDPDYFSDVIAADLADADQEDGAPAA